MMVSKRKTVLVAGRAGELASVANPLTFSLLEKIFGYRGPFRKVIQEFGIKVNDKDESYLKNIQGKVYTDINKENEIIWGNLPYRYYLDNEKVASTYDWSNNFVAKGISLGKKIAIETRILTTQLESYKNKATKKYKEYADEMKNVLVQRNIDSKKFLKLYEKVIFVTYLYELMYEFNRKDKLVTEHNEILKDYIRENDYLFASDESYIEQQLKLDYGFYLDNYSDLDKKMSFEIHNSKMVPDTVKKMHNTGNKKNETEVILQCLKNNMRLKTNVLLYFLNKTLAERSSKEGVKDFGMLTLDDIEGLTAENVETLKLKTAERKSNFDYSTAQSQPNILIIND